MILCFFFFNDTATTEIYTLSLHDALPICQVVMWDEGASAMGCGSNRKDSVWRLGVRMAGKASVRVVDRLPVVDETRAEDRKSTRLNSSHGYISYAVFCLKKKKKRDCSIKH